MEEVVAFIRSKTADLSRNPLIADWLQSDAIEPEHKLLFIPLALDFIMGFRDLNLYFVKYASPAGVLESALNAHADEDETHSELLLHDWAEAGMDTLLEGWTPLDLLWWLTSDSTLDTRRRDFQLAKLVYHNSDPLLRFAIIECIEATGSLLFPCTAAVVDAMSKRAPHKGPFLYFGQYHLDREDGHLQNADESLFLEAALTPSQRAQALDLVRAVFAIFDSHFAAWENLARSIYEQRWSFRPAVEGRLAGRSMTPPDAAVVNLSASMALQFPATGLLTGPGRDLARLRTQAVDELWRMPFAAWVRDPEGWAGDFRHLMRLVLQPWIVEAWASADFFLLDTPYPAHDALTPLQRGINRLGTLYAAEQKRRLVEWELLQLDEHTGWSLSDTLRAFWLHPEVEQHRAILAELRKLAFRFPAPLHRYWILKCFIRFQDALLRSLGVAMRQARLQEADDNFVTLAGHPERMHPDLPLDLEADQAVAEVELLPLAQPDVHIIRHHIIDGIKGMEARRLALSWTSIVQEQRYHKLAMKQPSCTPATAAHDRHHVHSKPNAHVGVSVAS